VISGFWLEVIRKLRCVRTAIGQELRARYPVPEKLPDALSTFVNQLDPFTIKAPVRRVAGAKLVPTTWRRPTRRTYSVRKLSGSQIAANRVCSNDKARLFTGLFQSRQRRRVSEFGR
jgi:hypothetical protein